MSDKPRRRIVMKATIEADSWDDLRGHIRDVLTQLHMDGRLSRCSVSGGYASGHIIEIDEDPEISHDSWFAEIGRYVAELGALETDFAAAGAR